MTRTGRSPSKRPEVSTKASRETATVLPGARVLYSIPDAAPLLGRQSDALRREIERRARADPADPGQIVAVLAGGVRAFRRVDGGRWAVAIPMHLRE